jgi:hypothetical protein
MYYVKHMARVLLLILAVQAPINASDVERSIMNDLSGIAQNICDLSIMAAKGLLWCGETAISATNNVTYFMKEHPVIATTLGLSAYAAWRMIKHRYGHRMYWGVNSEQTYGFCPSCGHVLGVHI